MGRSDWFIDQVRLHFIEYILKYSERRGVPSSDGNLPEMASPFRNMTSIHTSRESIEAGSDWWSEQMDPPTTLQTITSTGAKYDDGHGAMVEQ